MFVYQLLPKDFPEMDMVEQIDALVDVYEMLFKLSGQVEFKENIKHLEFVKTEFKKQNKSVSIFEIMGNQFSKEDFYREKMRMNGYVV
jgi:hypothetical protein